MRGEFIENCEEGLNGRLLSVSSSSQRRDEYKNGRGSSERDKGTRDKEEEQVKMKSKKECKKTKGKCEMTGDNSHRGNRK